jgi:hypothetical protein
MTRDAYHALRRAAFEASRAYCREADSDGRSSYASHGIRCLHALREAEAARNHVPHERDHLYPTQCATRRRRVLFCIKQRSSARKHAPSCVPSYTRDVRAALIPLNPEV